MKSPLFALLVPLVVGRVIELVLKSRWGRNALAARGGAELATNEGRQMVRKYASAAAAAAGTFAFAASRFGGARQAARTDRVATLHNASELLLAAGALVKVWADYSKDRQKLDRAAL